MNPISKAISDLKFKIPKAILKAAFTETNEYSGLNLRNAVSTEWRIRELVLEPRVLEDINLVSGQEITVSLKDLPVEYPDLYKTVWRIPLEKTNNRKITRVYSVTMGSSSTLPLATPYSADGGSFGSAAGALLAANVNIPNISTANIALIGENTVLVYQRHTAYTNLYLRCCVEHDESLNNLPPATYHKFSKLVEYAVKSYIYNNLILEIDKAQLIGGQELSTFLNIVENYADAEELYQEYLNDVWRSAAILSDPQAKKRHLSMLLARQ